MLAILILALDLPWSPVYFQPESDSSIYAYMGSAIAHGQVPYRDVMQGQPPIGFYIDAAAILLFGQSPWAIWWINVIWITASAIACFFVLRKMYGLIPSMLASLAFATAVMNPEIFQKGNLLEIFGLLFQVLTIGAVFLYFSTNNKKWIFAVGCLAGFAYMTKQTTTALGISSLITIVGISLLRREIKSVFTSVLYFLSGLVAIFGLATLYWSANGALYQFLQGILLLSLGYVGVGAPFLWSIKHTFLDMLPRLYISKLFYLAIASCVPYIIENILWYIKGVLPARIIHKPADTISKVDLTALLVFIALPIELVFTSLGGRNFGHYFITLIPACVTAIGYGLWKAALFLKNPRFDWKVKQTWAGVGGILLGISLCVWITVALVAEMPTPAQLASSSEIFSGRYPIGEAEEYVLATTQPNDPVLVWHIHLGLNFVTGRRPPQRIIYPGELFYPEGTAHSGLAEFLDQLEANPPELIFFQERSSIGLPFVNVPIDEMCPGGACLSEVATAMQFPDTISDLQEFRDFFLTRYAFDAQFGDSLVYRRIP
jgi:hypothetical protein